MHNPPHPGGIVRRQCLEPLGLTVAEAAEGIGVTPQALSDLVSEKTRISVEMAVRPSKAFGSIPKTRLAMQTAYDPVQAPDCTEEIGSENSRWRKNGEQERSE